MGSLFMRRGLGILLCGGLWLMATPTLASEASAVPRQQAELLAGLRDGLAPAFHSTPGSAERRERIRELIAQRFDLERIAATTLGAFWGAASPAERAGFQAVLSDHLSKMVARLLGTGTVAVDGAGAVRERDGYQYATLHLRTGSGIMPCTFVLNGASGGRISDVVIYGISLVTVKQSEFRSILEREGMPGLLAALAE